MNRIFLYVLAHVTVCNGQPRLATPDLKEANYWGIERDTPF